MPSYKLEEGSMQWHFYKSRAPIQIIGGGFGNGKTAAAVIKAITLAKDYPGSNGLMGRASYTKLNDTIRKEFYKWCPTGSVARWPTTTDNTMIFKNGSTINFRYIAQRGKTAADGQTSSNLLSATYDWIVIDQLEDPEITYKDFLDLQGRLRGSTPYKGNDPSMPMTGPRWFIGTCNPSSNWIYGKLIKPWQKYKQTGLVTDGLIVNPVTQEPLIEVFEGPTTGNAANLPEDFITRLEATFKGQMRKRFLLGEWASYEGLVYPDFSLEMHMKPREELIQPLYQAFKDKVRFNGMQSLDIGMVVPSCYLIGYTDTLGRVIIIDGVYQPGLTTSQLGKAIRDLQQMYAHGIYFREPIWADPAIFKQNQLQGKSVTTVANILRDEESLYLHAAQNDIKSGIIKVSSYLNPVEGLGWGPEDTAGPAMVFSEELDFVSDEFLAYFWKANEAGERIDTPIDRNDHAMDAVKYILTKAPEASELAYRKPLGERDYMKWQEMR